MPNALGIHFGVDIEGLVHAAEFIRKVLGRAPGVTRGAGAAGQLERRMIGGVLGLLGLLFALFTLPATAVIKLAIGAALVAATVRWSGYWVAGVEVGWGAALRAAATGVGLLGLMLVSLIFIGWTAVREGQNQIEAPGLWLLAAPLGFVLSFRWTLGLGWLASAMVALLSTLLAGLGFWLLGKLV